MAHTQHHSQKKKRNESKEKKKESIASCFLFPYVKVIVTRHCAVQLIIHVYLDLLFRPPPPPSLPPSILLRTL